MGLGSRHQQWTFLPSQRTELDKDLNLYMSHILITTDTSIECVLYILFITTFQMKAIAFGG